MFSLSTSQPSRRGHENQCLNTESCSVMHARQYVCEHGSWRGFLKISRQITQVTKSSMDLRMWGSILLILRSPFVCLKISPRKKGTALDQSSPSTKRPTAISHANFSVGKARYPSTDGWVRAHSIVRMQPISDSSITLILSRSCNCNDNEAIACFLLRKLNYHIDLSE